MSQVAASHTGPLDSLETLDAPEETLIEESKPEGLHLRRVLAIMVGMNVPAEARGTILFA